jgi:hypothetical protein
MLIHQGRFAYFSSDRKGYAKPIDALQRPPGPEFTEPILIGDDDRLGGAAIISPRAYQLQIGGIEGPVPWLPTQAHRIRLRLGTRPDASRVTRTHKIQPWIAQTIRQKYPCEQARERTPFLHPRQQPATSVPAKILIYPCQTPCVPGACPGDGSCRRLFPGA